MKTRSHAVHWQHTLLLLSILFVVAGCASEPEAAQDQGVSGTIVLWHSLPEARAAALNMVVNRFDSLHPDATILLRAFPSDDALVADFQNAVQSGLGADLILTGSGAVNTLAAGGAVRPLDNFVDDPFASQYLASALTTLRYDGQLYGLPFDLNTQVLYYNTEQVPTPATTLDQLAADARAGKTVLMNNRFRDALWGFRAFGALPQDAQTGALTFNPGGFVNWLTWLSQARDTPGFVLDPDQEMLYAAFLDGRGAYYVGRASDLPTLYEVLGDTLGVVPLPAGPSGSAGPLLTTTGFLINAMSSEKQAALALELARFATNPEQQAVMMRESLLAPANSTTRISPGLFPAIAAIEAQARTALALPNDAASVAALESVAAAFDGVVEGLTRPTDAALALSSLLDGSMVGVVAPQLSESCPPSGELTLSAYDVGATQPILDRLVQGYRLFCPDVTVTITLLPPAAAIRLVSADNRFRFDADLLFDLYGDVRYLIQNGQAADLTDFIPDDAVQSLRAQTLDGLRVAGRIYGLPVTIELPALYYNRELVADPAVTLDDLRSQAMSGVSVALDKTFDRAFWGIGAFGGQLTDEQGAFALDPVSTAAWLTWLLESRQQHNIHLEQSADDLRDAFAAGETAYYLGALAEATDLRARLGGNRLAVTVLPEGPRGAGRPLMRVGSMVANSELAEDQLALATHFMTYAISTEGQQQLLETGLAAPTNASVDLTGRTTAGTFLSQAQNAQIFNNQLVPPAVANLLRTLFNQVLAQDKPVADAIHQFYIDLDAYRVRFDTFTLAPLLETEMTAVISPTVVVDGAAVISDSQSATNPPLPAGAPITSTTPAAPTDLPAP